MDALRKLFHDIMPAVDFCSLRFVDECSEEVLVRQNILQPMHSRRSSGAMLTVIDQGGYGYAATSDLSQHGLHAAIQQAMRWASISAGKSVINFSKIPQSSAVGSYSSAAGGSLSRKELIHLLMQESVTCQIDTRIVDWDASISQVSTEQLFISSAGADIHQQFQYLIPNLSVTANQGAETQTRSLGGQYNGFCRQGGIEVLQQAGFYGAGKRVATEALALLHAPNCPTGRMDLLLLPEQMMLQIHESIGHPLELDRILGDERNFAGTSFVRPDMFGHFRYGSELLNVTYDPGMEAQFASFGWDDDGSIAEKTWLIRNGILEKPLGGALSQARAGMTGVANSRACNWNRPPIDRMANLNIEAGSSSLNDMIASVEYGVLMDTNVSWSIDDSRNKFQFGCEYGQMIRQGQLAELVRNPNYRGISENFWRSLKMVGDSSTLAVMGIPYCGKGEPSQLIRVGHASPACLFEQVDVFGGEA